MSDISFDDFQGHAASFAGTRRCPFGGACVPNPSDSACRECFEGFKQRRPMEPVGLEEDEEA